MFLQKNMDKEHFPEADSFDYLDRLDDYLEAVRSLQVVPNIRADIMEVDLGNKIIFGQIDQLLWGNEIKALLAGPKAETVFVKYIWPIILIAKEYQKAKQKLWKELDYRLKLQGRDAIKFVLGPSISEQQLEVALDRYKSTLDGYLMSLTWYRDSLQNFIDVGSDMPE
jgi:hypothetical protein